MSKEKLSKAQLVQRAKECKFFNRKGVTVMWGRENGHFYYQKPPAFKDGLASYKITKEDVEGNPNKLNAKDAIKAVEACKTMDELTALYTDNKIEEGKEAKTVAAAVAKKKEEFSSGGE